MLLKLRVEMGVVSHFWLKVLDKGVHVPQGNQDLAFIVSVFV